MLTLSSREEKPVMQDAERHWREAEPAVRAFIWSVIPHQQDAEDVLQRVAESVVAKYDNFDSTRPLSAWAIGFAKIELQRYRQSRRRQRVLFDTATVEALADAHEQSFVELQETRELLTKCLQLLRGRLRQVVELTYTQGLPPSEVAQRLGMTENAVFVSLHRARNALRRCVECHGDEKRGRSL